MLLAFKLLDTHIAFAAIKTNINMLSKFQWKAKVLGVLTADVLFGVIIYFCWSLKHIKTTFKDSGNNSDVHYLKQTKPSKSKDLKGFVMLTY